MTIPTAPVRPTALTSADAPALDIPARFMALGGIVIAVLAATAPWTVPLLLGGFYDPRLLAFVHVNTLGVIAAVIVGASYQLVPVVLQTPLTSPRIARLSFWCLLLGILAFLVGLLATWRPGLAIGGMSLAVAFGSYVWVIATTLRRAPVRNVVAGHLATALVAVTAAVVVGLTLALAKGTGILGPIGLRLLAAHATLMLGGWVAVTLTGVSYRLVGMFTLAEDALWHPGAWVELALTSLGAWMLAVGLIVDESRIRLVGGTLLFVGLVVYLALIARMYRHRLRRGIDVHMPFAALAGVIAVGAASLLVLGLANRASANDPIWVAIGWLAIAGVAETAIQGFAYKIASFLVWLHRYAPVAGRQRVPRLEEMYSRRLALVGWALWTIGLGLALVGIFAGDVTLARGAGFAVAAGLACFVVNVIGIAAHWRTPLSTPGSRPSSRPPDRRDDRSALVAARQHANGAVPDEANRRHNARSDKGIPTYDGGHP